MNNQQFLSKYDAEENFTEKELEEIALGEVGREVGQYEWNESRWHKDMSTVIDVDGRFFRIFWRKGLTELQEPEFPYQPEEVKMISYTRQINVVDWVSLDSLNDDLDEE